MADYGYLAVDRFLATELGARALALALESGLVDRLAAAAEVPESGLAALAGMAPAGRELFLALLAGAGVVERGAARLRLAPAFRAALAYRELIEAKLAFLALAGPDLARHLAAFVGGPQAFMAEAAVFDLFRYDRCLEVTPENLAATRRWVGYTSALTGHEAEALFDRLDLSGTRRLLDIGGNSGALALAACARAPDLEATVFDLPVVAALGREHVAGSPASGRIRFVAGDMRTDPLPGGHDLVTLKSVLHDWPEAEAAAILTRAARRVAAGGRLAIFERGPMALGDAPVTYAMAANLVFAHFYRPADLYAATLRAAGFADIRLERVALDMPFHLVTARRP